jgi:hypothetical protein
MKRFCQHPSFQRSPANIKSQEYQNQAHEAFPGSTYKRLPSTFSKFQNEDANQLNRDFEHQEPRRNIEGFQDLEDVYAQMNIEPPSKYAPRYINQQYVNEVANYEPSNYEMSYDDYQQTPLKPKAFKAMADEDGFASV